MGISSTFKEIITTALPFLPLRIYLVAIFGQEKILDILNADPFPGSYRCLPMELVIVPYGIRLRDSIRSGVEKSSQLLVTSVE